jgi:hypothetical protein
VRDKRRLEARSEVALQAPVERTVEKTASIRPASTGRKSVKSSPQPKRLNKNAWPKDPDGHYPEERWVDSAFFRAELRGRARTVHDGCAGWGRIVDAALAAGHRASGSDYKDQAGGRFPVIDFFDLRQRYDAIVSNSPFGGGRGPNALNEEQLVRHALTLAPYVAVIMRVAKLNAAKWAEELPLARVLLIHPRPSMPSASFIAAGGAVKDGTQDYCWALFERDHVGCPELRWLHCDEERREEKRREDN